jgi:hypothetical protein
MQAFAHQAVSSTSRFFLEMNQSIFEVFSHESADTNLKVPAAREVYIELDCWSDNNAINNLSFHLINRKIILFILPLPLLLIVFLVNRLQ